MKIPLQDISQQNLSMHKGENTGADVSAQVDAWIHAHQSLFNSWIAAAEQTAKK